VRMHNFASQYITIGINHFKYTAQNIAPLRHCRQRRYKSTYLQILSCTGAIHCVSETALALEPAKLNPETP